MNDVGLYNKKLLGCGYCKKICTYGIWLHIINECKKAPLDVKRTIIIPDYVKEDVSRAKKDWKDFIERKFEPHDFRARWKDIVCPYCLDICRNIYHTFVCSFVPQERRQVNKKIAFWKGT